MFYNATNNIIKIGNTDMDYITFGKGSKNLIMIPGLGDGLKTVKGSAAMFSLLYRDFAKDYKVYVFSRKNQLEEIYSTKSMAKDLAEVMKKLGIDKASVIGISQGGMIAQYVAIDYPELVDKLVLAVTLSKQNKTVQSVVSNWITMAKEKDYKKLFIDTMEKSYSDNKLKKYRPLYPILTKIGKPKDFTRFVTQANACINHNAYNELDKIKSETLVIGGKCDKIYYKYKRGDTMRICKQCNTEMLTGFDVKVDGAGYGIKVTESTKIFSEKIEKPKVAICPSCGEISLFIENIEKVLEKNK